MRYAAFLRAINVGTTNRVRSAVLLEVLAGTGCTNGVAYLQSGNLIFDADAPADDVAGRLEGACAALGLKGVSAMVRTQDELAAILAACPFDRYDTEALRRFVILYRSPLPASAAPDLGSLSGVVAVLPQEILTAVPFPAPPGPTVNDIIGRKVRVPGTARYWNVVAEVVARMGNS